MSVRYVYDAQSTFNMVITSRITWGLLGVLLVAIAAMVAYDRWLSNDDSGLASFLDHDSVTVYVVDNSQSVKEHVAFLSEQVQSIGVESKDNSQVGLILFGSESDVVLALDSVQAEKWTEASKQVNASMGHTNLFSAAKHGLSLLESVSPGVDRKLVIITDSHAQADAPLMPEVVEQATEHGVSVDTIALGDARYSAMLESLSNITGGKFYVWDDPSIAN